jgi:aryl-alcohol dehydrogenase-like predicted oxidoreductase
MDHWGRRHLAGLNVSALGLASSYGLSGADVERAFERGVNFFFWGSLRKSDFGRGVRSIAKTNREEAVIAIQSYSRFGWLMNWSVNRALRQLGTDYVDILCLAWWNAPPPRRIIDAARRLRDAGKVRKIMVSCHHRPTFEALLDEPAFDALMLRYNAAHTGAEREVFPLLSKKRRAGVLAFTATRWGTLVDPRLTPSNERTPRATDCYRFVLTARDVDACLTGPRDGRELDEALRALDEGPMDPSDLEWMRRVGASVRSGASPRLFATRTA